MKKNSILLLLMLSLCANNACAHGGLFNDMLTGAAIFIAGFGTVTVGTVSYGGYKIYQGARYRFSSTQEKIAAKIESMNADIEELEILNADQSMTPEERAESLKKMKDLNLHKIKQTEIALKYNIKKADA